MAKNVLISSHTIIWFESDFSSVTNELLVQYHNMAFLVQGCGSKSYTQCISCVRSFISCTRWVNHVVTELIVTALTMSSIFTDFASVYFHEIHAFAAMVTWNFSLNRLFQATSAG